MIADKDTNTVYFSGLPKTKQNEGDSSFTSSENEWLSF